MSCYIFFNREGNITAIDHHSVVMKDFASCTFDQEIDATGKCILPGKDEIKIVFMMYRRQKGTL